MDNSSPLNDSEEHPVPDHTTISDMEHDVGNEQVENVDNSRRDGDQSNVLVFWRFLICTVF